MSPEINNNYFIAWAVRKIISKTDTLGMAYAILFKKFSVKIRYQESFLSGNTGKEFSTFVWS